MIDYKTKEDWCESFLTCFHSSVLQRRCLEDFYFYKQFFLQSPRQQAFTFEIALIYLLQEYRSIIVHTLTFSVLTLSIVTLVGGTTEVVRIWFLVMIF